MVWGMFSWHTLGPLIPVEHCLNATYVSIVADHMYPFIAAIYPTYVSIQHDNVPCHKSSQTGSMNIKMCLVYFTGLPSHHI